MDNALGESTTYLFSVFSSWVAFVLKALPIGYLFWPSIAFSDKALIIGALFFN